jgi:hypothetical protein
MIKQIVPFSKTGLLERIQSEHHKLEILLAQLDENQMTQPGVVGDWSIKDILAHIAAWEQSMLLWVGETRQGITPRQPSSNHELHGWNHSIYQQNQPRPLAKVLTEFHQSYQKVLQSITDTPEEELSKEIHGAWPEGPLWQGVANNTWGHYKEHAASIRAWMKKNI